MVVRLKGKKYKRVKGLSVGGMEVKKDKINGIDVVE